MAGFFCSFKRVGRGYILIRKGERAALASLVFFEFFRFYMVVCQKIIACLKKNA